MKIKDYFTKDLKPRQKQYEALRAVAFAQSSIEEISDHFGYSPQSLRTLISRLLSGKHQLFPDVKTGPKTRHTSENTVELIIRLRREKRLSSEEISQELIKDGISVSIRTVERILKDAGFDKLCRRTDKQRGVNKKGVVIASRSSDLDFEKLKPFRADCQVAGIYMFLPYIIESGILDIVSDCNMAQSSDIGKVQASLSMLLLKLIGNERLANIANYDTDIGFGIFAGLNALPKPSYICSYSCRTDAAELMEFQKGLLSNLSIPILIYMRQILLTWIFIQFHILVVNQRWKMYGAVPVGKPLKEQTHSLPRTGQATHLCMSMQILKERSLL